MTKNKKIMISISALMTFVMFLSSCKTDKDTRSDIINSNDNSNLSEYSSESDSSDLLFSSITEFSSLDGVNSNAGTGSSKMSSSNSSTLSSIKVTPTPVGNVYTIDFEAYYTQSSSNFTKALERVVAQANILSTDDRKNNKNYQVVVRITKRQYTLSSSVTLNNATNLVLDAQGSSFVYSKAVSAFVFSNCTNITLKNLSIDYNPMQFTQGEITKIEENGKFIEIKIDPGYPTDPAFLNASGCQANFIDPATGAFRANTRDSFAPSSVTSVGNNILRLNIGWAITEKIYPVAADIKNGDLMVVGAQGPQVVVMNYCKGINFQNLDMYSGNGSGFLEWYGEGGNSYNNVRVTPGPIPVGATRQRLQSITGDCIHSASVKKGPLIENCLFEKQKDDGINIHGFYGYVVKVIDDNNYIVSPKYAGIIDIGDNVEFTNGGSYEKIGTSKATAIKVVSDLSLKPVVNSVWGGKHPPQSNTYLFQMTLDAGIKLQVGDAVNSIDKVGAGCIVRNSTFRGNRSRGIVLKSYNALIEGNTIENTGYSGIYLSSEIGYWGESDFSHDYIIRNNKITGSGSSINTKIASCVEMGAITLSLSGALNFFGLYEARRNYNISITDNTILDSFVYGIFCTNSENVTISKNTIKNCWKEGSYDSGAKFNIRKIDSVIFLAMVNKVSITNNTFGYNSFATKNISQGDQVENLTVSGNN